MCVSNRFMWVQHKRYELDTRDGHPSETDTQKDADPTACHKFPREMLKWLRHKVKDRGTEEAAGSTLKHQLEKSFL